VTVGATFQAGAAQKLSGILSDAAAGQPAPDGKGGMGVGGSDAPSLSDHESPGHTDGRLNMRLRH